jgi:hypothetical protein
MSRFNAAFYEKVKNLGGGTTVSGFCKSHTNEVFFNKIVSFDIQIEPKVGFNFKLGDHFYHVNQVYLDLDTSIFMCLVRKEEI